MIKKLKMLGNSLVITFSKEEKEIYGLKEGDTIDISDMLVEKKRGKKNE